jgi:hypothetical protein
MHMKSRRRKAGQWKALHSHSGAIWSPSHCYNNLETHIDAVRSSAIWLLHGSWGSANGLHHPYGASDHIFGTNINWLWGLVGDEVDIIGSAHRRDQWLLLKFDWIYKHNWLYKHVIAGASRFFRSVGLKKSVVLYETVLWYSKMLVS